LVHLLRGEHPYSLAAVCSFWRDILCSHPEFWTLVVLFVDSKPTPLVESSFFLKWSRRHHIDDFITRRDKLRPTSYRTYTKIDAFFRMRVKPHLRHLFLVPQRPMCFPYPIPFTSIHLRPPLFFFAVPTRVRCPVLHCYALCRLIHKERERRRLRKKSHPRPEGRVELIDMAGRYSFADGGCPTSNRR